MSDPTTLAAYLQQTMTGTTESIKEAQKSLQSNHSFPNFLGSLLLIVKQPSVTGNIRKSAAIYTKKYIKSCLIEHDQNKLNAAAEQLLNELSNTNTDIILRKYIASSLEYLLMNDAKFVIREKFNPLCQGLLADAVPKNGTEVNFEFIAFFTQTLLSSFIHTNKQMNIFLQKSLINFTKVSQKLFGFFESIVNTEDKQQILRLFRIFKMYSNILKIYVKKMMFAEIQSAKLLYDENFTLLLSTGVNFMIKNNQLSTNIIYFNESTDGQILQLFHNIKSDYIQTIQSTYRTIILLFKDKQMLEQSPILSSPSLIPSMISSLSSLLALTQYHQVKSASLIKLVENILHCLIHTARNMYYYQCFQQMKKDIVDGIVLKVLVFNKDDLDYFLHEPEEFLNRMLQVVEMDTGQFVKNYQRERDGGDPAGDTIQLYSNLRTLAATLLQALCKHIDGSLAQILTFCLQAIQSSQPCPIPRSLLLLMLSILRTQILQRTEHTQILPTLSALLQQTKAPCIPTSSSQQQYSQNIEYFIMLLTLYRYLNIVEDIREQDLRVFFQVVYNIVGTENTVMDALRLQAFQLVFGLCEREEIYELKFIELINGLLSNTTKMEQRCLQTLTSILSTRSNTLSQNIPLVVQTAKLVSQLVLQQLQSASPNQLLINKYWNVLGAIYQNQKFIPQIIPQFQLCVMPLTSYIDGKTAYDFEEDIFMMMSSFIDKSKKVTQSELSMFQIIPRLFYSQYEHQFGHAFETLQIFIMYGKDILKTNLQAIKIIIEMAVVCMNTVQFQGKKRSEGDNTAGVVIIQSLILSCGDCFSPQVWIEVTKALTKRLENPVPQTHILHSNILATLTLILAHCHQIFTAQDCDILLNRILQNTYCFVVKYSIKLFIISLSTLLPKYDQQFISNRYTLILSTLIMLLECYEKKEVFNCNPLTDEERDYDVVIDTTKNWVLQADEVEYFRNKVLEVRNKNVDIIKKTLQEIGEKQAEFLRKIVNTVSVKNQARPIFKIKK